MLVMQKRDQEILNFLQLFNCATTGQIKRLFFSHHKTDNSAITATRKRLKKLYDSKLIKRERTDLNTEYFYYLKKTKNLIHESLVVDVYINLLHQPGELIEFIPEYDMGDIRSDAYIVYKHHNISIPILLEVHRGTNSFDQAKYENFVSSGQHSKYFKGFFPKVCILTDNKLKLQQSRIPYYTVPTDCKGIEKILKR